MALDPANAAGGGGAGGGPAGGASTSLDHGIPAGMSWAGLVVGIGLIAAGIFAMLNANLLYSIGALSVCMGFGLTLAVFGTRAAGIFYKFNIAGAGAMAVALYILLFNVQMVPFETYVKGTIQQTENLKSVLGSAKQNFFVGRPKKTGDYEFVIFRRDLEESQIYFHFEFPEGNKLNELYIGCIEPKVAKAAMEAQRELVFSLEQDATNGTYFLVNNETSQRLGRINQRRCGTQEPQIIPASEIGLFDILFPSAFAGSLALDRIQSLPQLLESEDPDQRDYGRALIGDLTSKEEYAALAAAWDVKASSYRADLGHLVGWSDAIQRDRRTSVYIAETLSEEQVRYLVQLTGQGDFTLRQHATEILHRLLETTSWPSGPSAEQAQMLVRTVAESLTPMSTPPQGKTGVDFSAANRLYNTLVSVGFTDCNIGPQYRPILIDALTDLRRSTLQMPNLDKTKAKSDQVLNDLRSC